MHALSLRLTAAVLGVALASPTLAAQAGTRPTFGVAAGATFPTGDLGDGYDSGYNLGAHVGFRSATMPVGFRLEGTYNRHDAKGVNPLDTRLTIFSGTANVIAGASGAAESIRPYLIGGAGVYNVKVDSDGVAGSSSTKFGLNGGAGLDLPLSGIAVFAEARYHYVFSKEDGTGFNMGFIPLTVGIRF